MCYCSNNYVIKFVRYQILVGDDRFVLHLFSFAKNTRRPPGPVYIYIEREREREIDMCMNIYIYIYIYRERERER